MATGRSQPSLIIAVQVLVTHAASVATMERELGHPPRLIRAPDVCDLFQARDGRAAAGHGGPLGILGYRGAGGPDPPHGGAVHPRQASHPIILPRTGRP
jgi:hypothetical protein